MKIPETSEERKIDCHEPPSEEFPPFPSVAALLLVYEQGSALEVSTKHFPSVKETKLQRTSSGLRTKKVMKTTKHMETCCDLCPPLPFTNGESKHQ